MNVPVCKTACACAVLLGALALRAAGQSNSPAAWSWVPDAQARGQGLPPGLPRTVDTNGTVEYINHHFTTPEYRDETRRLMVQEASHVAQALDLERDPPLTPERFNSENVTPFGFFYQQGLMGSVATTNYTYQFMAGGRLNQIEINHSYEVWRDLQDRVLPEDQVDNHAAYQLATQWLTALSVDVGALNRDCQLTVAASPVFNYVGSGQEPIRRQFAPTYDITWKTTNGPAAFVQLYLPDKRLIQLSVDDPQYNLRPPLAFTNLAALFPGTACIQTNYPIPPTVIDMGQTENPEVTFITDSNQPEPTFHGLRLSHWIRTQTRLNPKHLSLAQMVTLKPVAGPDEWGDATFDLPVPFDAFHSDNPMPGGTMDLGFLNPDGNFIECTFHECERAPDGNTRATWSLNWNAPGWHDLRARLTYYHGMDGDQFNLIGPALAYHSSNSCRFYEASTLFNSDGADLNAELREPVASFRVLVTSLTGRLINDISGHTTNGEIGLAWDLTGLDGQKYTNNSFIGTYCVSYPDDTQTNPPVKARYNKIGTSGD